jgi:hypothetical protein
VVRDGGLLDAIFEGVSHGFDSVKKHAIDTVGGAGALWARYDYDANGNVKVRHKGLIVNDCGRPLLYANHPSIPGACYAFDPGDAGASKHGSATSLW